MCKCASVQVCKCGRYTAELVGASADSVYYTLASTFLAKMLHSQCNLVQMFGAQVQEAEVHNNDGLQCPCAQCANVHTSRCSGTKCCTASTQEQVDKNGGD